MDDLQNLFDLYDYESYTKNFTQWRKDTIHKLKSLDEDDLYYLEDQILRHDGFDAKRFNDNPVAGSTVKFLTELFKPFIEKPYRKAFYTQLNAITQNIKKDKKIP